MRKYSIIFQKEIYMELLEELEDIIRLNNEQRQEMTKQYMLLYLKSILIDYKGNSKRKTLLKNLLEYRNTIKCENDYMLLMIKNVYKIQKSEELNYILDELDILNEKTYLYYLSIIEEYEENIDCNLLDRKIDSPRKFNIINEREDIKEKVYSITNTKNKN
jgi:hypothetical protein